MSTWERGVEDRRQRLGCVALALSVWREADADLELIGVDPMQPDVANNPRIAFDNELEPPWRGQGDPPELRLSVFASMLHRSWKGTLETAHFWQVSVGEHRFGMTGFEPVQAKSLRVDGYRQAVPLVSLVHVILPPPKMYYARFLGDAMKPSTLG